MKIKPNESERSEFSLIDGPVFYDACEHGPECFIASFEVLDHVKRETEKFDLYLFPQAHYGTEVCIRYGAMDSEYISPGGLGEFLIQALCRWPQNPTYHNAAKLLVHFGILNWAPRT